MVRSVQPQGTRGAGEWQVPPGNVESPAGWQEVSLLRVSQNIRHFDHVVPADRSPRARSRLEGAKTRPRTDGRKPGWQRRPRKTCPGRNWPRSGTSERKQPRAARQRRCRWHTCLSLDLPPPWDIVLLCTAATTASVSQDRERKGRRTRLSGSAPGRCSLSLHSQGLAQNFARGHVPAENATAMKGEKRVSGDSISAAGDQEFMAKYRVNTGPVTLPNRPREGNRVGANRQASCPVFTSQGTA